MEDNVTISPQCEFYQVTVEIKEEDENGKIKKIKEEHLVDGRFNDVKTKVEEYMKGTMAEWKIVKCQTSKIIVVY